MGQFKMSPSVVFRLLASETPENYILVLVLIMFFKKFQMLQFSNNILMVRDGGLGGKISSM